MDYLVNQLNNFLHETNEVGSDNWIECIQFEPSNNNHLTIYFPHKFLYEWFINYKKLYFEQYLFSKYPTILNIEYKFLNPKKKSNSLLEPYEYDSRYLFDNFLYNQKNEVAIITIQEIFKDEMDKSNSFLILGNPGTGKTHLLKAISNDFFLKNKKILYTNPQKINNYLESLKSVIQYHNIFHGFDIVCIDDFHYINKYKNIQSDIFYLLKNRSINRQKVIIASNNNEYAYQNIESRLFSRLQEGIHIRLINPDMDVKMHYIANFCRQNHLSLTDEQIIYLARQFDNFRDIQTVLFRIKTSQALQTGQAKDTDSLLQQEVSSVTSLKLTPQAIISQLSEFFNIPSQQILSATKRRDIVRTRQMGMTICRQSLGMSYPRIGEAFGGKDHSTVIHSINNLLKLIKKDKELQALFQSVKQRCEQLLR